MGDMTIFTTTEVTIHGYNSEKPLVFSDLELRESLQDVNQFKFSVQTAHDDNILNKIVEFKKQVIGASVSIIFKNEKGDINRKFEGIINELEAAWKDGDYYEFYISGFGKMGSGNELKRFRHFKQMKVSDVIKKVSNELGVKINYQKGNTSDRQIQYLVQYNQTDFEFLAMLAKRYGIWMYYTGTDMYYGEKPKGEAQEFNVPEMISRLRMRTHMGMSASGFVSADFYKGEGFSVAEKSQTPKHDVIESVKKAADTVIRKTGDELFTGSGYNNEQMKEQHALAQQAEFSNTVFIEGKTRESSLKIGGIIKLKGKDDQAAQSFILTELTHHTNNGQEYENRFKAVPHEVTVPPYTDPLIIVKAKPQAAFVVNNEDDKGLARVKVKFPWMKDGETPWISSLVPQAGKGRGFRFLPEIGDEVLVDFIDENIDLPYVKGAIYTEKNKPNIAEKNNDIKLIGTKSGRRLEFGDLDDGYIKLYDSQDNKDGNGITLRKKQSEMSTEIKCGSDGKDLGVILFENSKGINIGVSQNNTVIAEIVMDLKNKEIKIVSNGTISMQANDKISLKTTDFELDATNVKIKAKSKIELESNGAIDLKAMGLNMKANASAKLEAGVKLEVKGAVSEVSSSGPTIIKGAVVMIN